MTELNISYHEATRQFWNKESGIIRYNLYKSAIKKAKTAIENGFYIEAVAIYEGIIADRLESRLQFLLNNEDVKIQSVGSAAYQCKKNDNSAENPIMFELYKRIFKWATKRNFVMHNMVKIKVDDTNLTFEKRYNIANQAAIEGVQIFNDLKKEIDRQKRRMSKTKA